MIDKRPGPAPEPRVTIVIPCFKQEVFLFECLNSLIAQTMPAWEAVVVDDCSPARMAHRIVSSYKDPRVRSIRHDTNRGLAASRNTGLQAGHARFALCIDADDFLDPEFLSTTLDAIERRSADCVYTEFQLVGLSNDVWRWELKSADELAAEQWIPGPGVLMRRSVWERVGSYSEELRWNEDWDFWIGAMSAGCSFHRVPHPLYFYRRHSHTMSSLQSWTTEWMTREVILKKRAEFFAVRNRAKTFRGGGLVKSANAHRALGHRWQSLKLTARAVTVDPNLLYSESSAAIRRQLRPLRSLERELRSIISGIGQDTRVGIDNGQGPSAVGTSMDWNTLAIPVHDRYGYLSHDYAVLGQIIERTSARSVLQVGCGSGRLVPVYLMHDLRTIWLQDVSGRALDLCRERFFRQDQIRYFRGSIQAIPKSMAIDLIVANRVFQHIIEDAEFLEILAYLASMTHYFYINEASIEDTVKLRDPHLKGRDYVRTFRDLGWRIAGQGQLTAEFGTLQAWTLFEKEKGIHVGSAARAISNLNV